jgi:hypothetical protein
VASEARSPQAWTVIKHPLAWLSGRSQDHFRLTTRVDFHAPGGALRVRDRAINWTVSRSSGNAVKKAHGINGDIAARGRLFALLDQMVKARTDFSP